MTSPNIIGFVYNSGVPAAHDLVLSLIERFGLQDRSWDRPAIEIGPDTPEGANTDLIITVGGDGTILRTAGLSVVHGAPILGINMGRLGFMTELKAGEAFDKVPMFLEGSGRIEERSIAEAKVTPIGRSTPEPLSYKALNDIVVGRGSVARLVRIKVSVEGALLTEFRADALIVSTATGSTGYNLSVGGPILSPTAGDMIIKAVAPHIGIAPALVVPPKSKITLEVQADHQVMLSVDGYLDLSLNTGDTILVQQSPLKARFLRSNPPSDFYDTLTQRLGFGGGQSRTRALQY